MAALPLLEYQIQQLVTVKTHGKNVQFKCYYLPSKKKQEFLVNCFYVDAEPPVVKNDFRDLEAIYSWLKCTYKQEEGVYI